MHGDPGRSRPLAPALLLATALAAGPAAAADLASPSVSGLPWRSGAVGGGFPCLAQLRGRALDAFTFFVDHTSFAAMVRQTTSGNMRALAAKVLEEENAIVAKFHAIFAQRIDSWRTRYHGRLHLGHLVR